MIVFGEDGDFGKRLACLRCGWLSGQELDFDHPCKERCATISSHTFGPPKFKSPKEIPPLIHPVNFVLVAWRYCNSCHIRSAIFHIRDTGGKRHTLIEAPLAKCSTMIMRKVLG